MASKKHTQFPYAVIVPLDFNPAWRTLKDPTSVKAAIINQLAVMHGYGKSHELFVKDFKGQGKVCVEGSQISIQFINLDTLGINTDSHASLADIDQMLRARMTFLADPITEADKIAARNKIIGTLVNGISTVPDNPHCHRS